jgi:hypothetical protein
MMYPDTIIVPGYNEFVNGEGSSLTAETQRRREKKLRKI